MNNFNTGLEISVVGILTVFAVLFILFLVMKLMEKVFYDKNEIQVTSVDDEEEKVAVITAVLASVMKVPAKNLKISSIKKKND